MTVTVLCLFLTVLWVGPHSICVIVAFTGHIRFAIASPIITDLKKKYGV